MHELLVLAIVLTMFMMMICSHRLGYVTGSYDGQCEMMINDPFPRAPIIIERQSNPHGPPPAVLAPPVPPVPTVPPQSSTDVPPTTAPQLSDMDKQVADALKTPSPTPSGQPPAVLGIPSLSAMDKAESDYLAASTDETMPTDSGAVQSAVGITPDTAEPSVRRQCCWNTTPNVWYITGQPSVLNYPNLYN